MSLDRKQTKGYRKAWNGGTPPAETVDSLAFHRHLDACQQCREHPFDLCGAGSFLLQQAVKNANVPSPKEPQP